MSVQLIQQYHAQVDRIVRYGGSRNESSLRKAFQDLLEHYSQSKNLVLIAELEYRTSDGHVIFPDGTLKDALRQDWGYWESKDQYDDLEAEIREKLARGYPSTNILFEDTKSAILYQRGKEVLRTDFKDEQGFHRLLTMFVSYEPKEVGDFREAINRFTREVPGLADDLREIIDEQSRRNLSFQQSAQDFLELCRRTINPAVELPDVREMIIQHILTQDIFTTIFDEPQFHLENNIARRLGEVVSTFFKGNTRRTIHDRISPYFTTINARAAQIHNHHEKQRFLKVLYEKFYKAYNPKAADRLGVVYTPGEIVHFMVEAADYLVHKHFGKTLGSPGVEILDPTTGTGTYITELIEYLPPHLLEHKYRHEIHCNEVAILPYYIANLNIEYTYKQKMGRYVEFENILFVDTLDNMGFAYTNKQLEFFGMTDENAARIKRQNERKISVIIGNPPYNANQLNENENNKNRDYPEIDQRIKVTYVKHSTAQKTKSYDMYKRFYRWASDRIADDGIVAFVTNRSFLDARDSDGFRKVIATEFSHIYVVDLGGGVNKNPKLSGPKHNVFGIKTGVAICFMVKRRDRKDLPCQIFYTRRPEMELAVDKLRFLSSNSFSQLAFEQIQPDKRHTWINQSANTWDDLVPVASKKTKLSRKPADEQAIFKLFSLGVVTNRDEWVYDFSRSNLTRKIEFFVKLYNGEVDKYFGKVVPSEVKEVVDYTIKWTRAVKGDLSVGRKYVYRDKSIIAALYRPFVKQYLYFDPDLNEMQYQLPDIFRGDNVVIAFTSGASEKPFLALATDNVPDLHLTGAGTGAQCLPLYRYDTTGNRRENITDWALVQFQTHYADNSITKEAIFHYIYAVFHNPTYRQKYERNLKRDLPYVPRYSDFWQWVLWGQRLMDLHLHYEIVEPFPLQRHDYDPRGTRTRYQSKLKANKKDGFIQLDTLTTLSGVPDIVWTYMLGNRSALEWILDRYKERKPSDPTINEKFYPYRFINYKEQVIDLLRRVTTVSFETMKIIEEMQKRRDI